MNEPYSFLEAVFDQVMPDAVFAPTNQKTKKPNMTNTIDSTENIRRETVGQLNTAIESLDRDTERQRLEKLHGQVWTTNEMTAEFECIGFMGPFVVVRRRADSIKGSLMFQHAPRFYFRFTPA